MTGVPDDLFSPDVLPVDVRAAALLAHERGWHPVPLPAGCKSPPPIGLTGAAGVDLTVEEIAALAWTGNLGLRVPEFVLGIDTDCYHDGGVTLAKLIDECGPPPPTFASHSQRGDGSCIRFFIVPVGRFWRDVPPGVEMIQHTYRFAAVAPSVHPEGRRYVWHDEAEDEPCGLPHVDDLPELPLAWIEALRSGDAAASTTSFRPRGGPVTPAMEAVLAEVVQQHEGTEVARRNGVIYVRRPERGKPRQNDYQATISTGDNGDAVLRVWTSLWDPFVERRTYVLRTGHGLIDVRRADAVMFDKVLAASSTAGNGGGATSADNRLSTSGRTLTLPSVEMIVPRRVRWLWEDRVPLGALTLLAGREGIGKSILAYWMAAQLTQGTLPGEFYGQQRRIVVASTEDAWAETIVPRLLAAGADLSRVHRVDVRSDHAKTARLVLPHDIEGLTEAVVDLGAPFVLLDPLISRLDAALDTHRDGEVRQGLEPLTDAADRGRFSVVGLIHVNKTATSDPLTTVMASRAFVAVARAVLFTVLDPEQPGMRLLGNEKNNLGRMDLPTRMFEVVSKVVGQDPVDGRPVETGMLRWVGDSQRTVREAIRDAARSPDSRDAQREAEGWLRDWLRANPVSDSKDVKQAGRDEGHSERTLKRARKKIGAGVLSVGFPRRTVWSKPGVTPDDVEKIVASWAKP
jgi:hypothetical protein